ncbi:MAG TPA: PKD domain-containing protein, partial [Candidatus Eisenbacteria bacterium]|nr:PKD domain-containing protein [Candidatus Eisenbacteria bacterium]
AGSDGDNKTGYVVVSDPTPPVAAFSGSPRTGAIPLAVQFTDQSTAGSYPITAWSWAFGDGATSTSQNPSHTYAAAGSYTVTLTVTTAAGSDGQTSAGYIVATEPPNAAFEGAPRSGDRPLAVQFNDLSTAGSAPITSWAWSFGDGATSTAQNPTHTYTVAGTYTVGLTVTTADGTDAVTAPAYIAVTEPPAPPTAAFTGAPTSGPAPLAVQFADQSAPGTAPITSWAWTFGDGATSTAQSPSHTYLLPGAYDVSLSVTTADGVDTATKIGFVTVCAPPTAEFSAAPTTGLAPLTVQFTDLSIAGTGAVASWAWTFGDGATSVAQSPSHEYTTPGTYDVSLTVTDACGSNTATKAGHVVVQDPCTFVTYSIADASIEIRADADQDGCIERSRVHFDADVSGGCSKSVFAKVLARPEGSTAWTFETQSACFTITGTGAGDATWVQVQNLPPDFYELRVELYECGGTLPVAARDYADDPDLDNRCYE